MAYMDDITVVVQDMRGFNRVLRTVDWFCGASGFKVNYEKSGVLRLGGFNLDSDCNLLRGSEMKILGIYFTENCGSIKNWESLLERVRKKVCFWKLRSLTMEGKIVILKQVILPMVLYISSVFMPSFRQLKNLIRICFTFFWNSNMEKVRREEMYKSKEKGGKGFPDFKRFLYAKHIAYCVGSLLGPAAHLKNVMIYKKIQMD